MTDNDILTKSAIEKLRKLQDAHAKRHIVETQTCE
jgi:hypothetical protein